MCFYNEMGQHFWYEGNVSGNEDKVRDRGRERENGRKREKRARHFNSNQ